MEWKMGYHICNRWVRVINDALLMKIMHNRQLKNPKKEEMWHMMEYETCVVEFLDYPNYN